MSNAEFLKILTESFRRFLETGSRSNEKLKILHGAIASDLKDLLGPDYEIKSLGYGDGKEGMIKGRYIDKAVDITVLNDGLAIAGIGVKFVMQNYSQNSNNYFENMLGETANIRSRQIPYFQIFIIPDNIPYYDNSGIIRKWETFSGHNAEKYRILSHDDACATAHTPDKTLLYVVHLTDLPDAAKSCKKDYICGYEHMEDPILYESGIKYGSFSNAVIYNDYETFIKKVAHRILSI